MPGEGFLEKQVMRVVYGFVAHVAKDPFGGDNGGTLPQPPAIGKPNAGTDEGGARVRGTGARDVNLSVVPLSPFRSQMGS